jgi:hypothetical protein
MLEQIEISKKIKFGTSADVWNLENDVHFYSKKKAYK